MLVGEKIRVSLCFITHTENIIKSADMIVINFMRTHLRFFFVKIKIFVHWHKYITRISKDSREMIDMLTKLSL